MRPVLKLVRAVVALSAVAVPLAACNVILGLDKLHDGCVVTECPAPVSPCQIAICAGNQCGVASASAGVAPGRAAGSCSQFICDGSGNATTQNFTVGTSCANDAGNGVCDGMGTCVGCNTPADCASGVCKGSQCAAPTCTDGVKNGDETDLDCGGSCPPCKDGMACSKPTDCKGGACDMGTCCTPTTCAALGLTCGMAPDACGGMLDCNNGVKDGTETDIDCGGPNCPACTPGKTCNASNDCNPKACNQNVCCNFDCASVCAACDLPGSVGSCTPVPMLQMTAGCGTNLVPTHACDGSGECKYANGAACGANSDCASGSCTGSPKTCQ